MYRRKCRRQHFRCFPFQHSVFISPPCLPSPSLPTFFVSSFLLSPSPASLSLSPSLVYLLSQPRKSRDYQRNNPSGRGLLLPASAESLLFFPLLFPSVLSYFLSEAGGEDLMMGDIPLLVWCCKTPKHPALFLTHLSSDFSSFSPLSSFLSRLSSACLLQFNQTHRYPHKHTYCMHPSSPPEPPVSS